MGTPPEGIRAEVLVVKDFDDLEANAHLVSSRSGRVDVTYIWKSKG